MKKLLRYLGIISCFLFILIIGTISNVSAATKNITVDKYSDYEWDYDKFYIGDSGQLFVSLENDDYYDDESYDITYESSDTNILNVDDKGHYKIIGSGQAYVNITVKYERTVDFDGYIYTETGSYDCSYGFHVYDDVSKMTLVKSNITCYLVNGYGTDTSIPLANAPSFQYYDFSYSSSNTSMSISCTLDTSKKAIVISAYSKGNTTVSITINGKTFYIKLTCKKVSINKTGYVLAKKKKTTIKLKNYSTRKWYSTNKKVATVSSKGTVKGKKVGNAVIYTIVNGQRIGCAVSVVDTKLKKVITKARKISKGKYSQAKRMQKGYYDCSSLVWRAYSSQKIYLVNRNYAPVAADLCKGLIKKKVKGGYSYKNLQKMKLRPGDLYCQGGSNNGRYKGIYHVEMFVGYKCIGFNGKTPYLIPLWAARPDGYYWCDGDTIVRPRK